MNKQELIDAVAVTARVKTLLGQVDAVIDEVVHVWLPTQRHLAHPATDLVLEVRRRCELAGLQPP
ncbi:hypothetical protein [Burkholderia stabilis]|uniref:hypothetical protein n=1 Tax=Burkholderia stabilis TaxID=95485 RepID=UPI001F0BF54B|nr:hypothetical protein [Burkholderia stabilis]